MAKTAILTHNIVGSAVNLTTFGVAAGYAQLPFPAALAVPVTSANKR